MARLSCGLAAAAGSLDAPAENLHHQLTADSRQSEGVQHHHKLTRQLSVWANPVGIGLSAATIEDTLHTHGLAPALGCIKYCQLTPMLLAHCAQHGTELDQEHYKLPRMRYKGGSPPSQCIRKEAKPLISEVHSVFRFVTC